MNNQLVKQNNGVALVYVSPQDQKALQSLLPAERKIIEAGLQPKINEREPLSVVEELISVISATFTRSGQQVPQDGGATIALYADELFETLNEKFPRVTVAEVAAALKAGVYGEAGEYFGLNPKSFLQFVRHYLFKDERKEAQKMFGEKQLLLSSQCEFTQAQKDQSTKDFINSLYESYLTGNLLVDVTPVHLFEFLLSSGFIKTPIEENEIMLQRAESYLTRLKTAFKTNSGPKSFKDSLKGMNLTTTVQNIARRFAITEYFENCKIEGKATIFQTTNLLEDEKY